MADKEIFNPENEPYNEKMVEYIYDIYELMDVTGVPKGLIPEEVVETGAEMLVYLYENYGDPDSETYKLHHNDQHALSVLRRCWVQASLRKRLFPAEFSDKKDYILGMFGALGHDSVHGSGGKKGEDERLSGIWTCGRMYRLGFGDEDCQRVREMISTTEVTTDANGAIVQTNIQQGSRDILKLELAIADINGIAMEGTETMVNDAFNLCLEFNRMSVSEMINHLDVVERFFATQAKFVEKRLNSLKSDFEYYYGEQAAAVSKMYENVFTDSTRQAKGAAHTIYRFPVIRKRSIEDVIQKAADYMGSDAEKLALAKAELNVWLTRLTPEEAASQA